VVLKGMGYKFAEQGVRFHRGGFEFRMKLPRQEPRVVSQLNNLDQVAAGRDPTDSHPRFFQLKPVFIIEFVTMAVAFIDFPVAISGKGERFFSQLTGVLTQSHGPALITIHILIVHQVDDGVRRIRFKFRAGEVCSV